MSFLFVLVWCACFCLIVVRLNAMDGLCARHPLTKLPTSNRQRCVGVCACVALCVVYQRLCVRRSVDGLLLQLHDCLFKASADKPGQKQPSVASVCFALSSVLVHGAFALVFCRFSNRSPRPVAQGPVQTSTAWILSMSRTRCLLVLRVRASPCLNDLCVGREGPGQHCRQGRRCRHGQLCPFVAFL